MADVEWMIHHGLIRPFDSENALQIALNGFQALPDATASESAAAFCRRVTQPPLQYLPVYEEKWDLTAAQKRSVAALVKGVSKQTLRANLKEWQDDDPIPVMVEPYRMRDEIIFSRKTSKVSPEQSFGDIPVLQPIEMVELDEQCAEAEQAIPSVDTLLEIKMQSTKVELESIRKHYLEAQSLKASARSEIHFDPLDLETEEMISQPYLTPPLFPRSPSDNPPELHLDSTLLDHLQPITPPRQQPTALLPTGVLNDWENVRPLRTPPHDLSPLSTEQPSSSICMTEHPSLDHLKLEPMLFPRSRSGSTSFIEALRRSNPESDDVMDMGVQTAFDLLAQEYEPLLLPDENDKPMDFAQAAGLIELLDAESFEEENKILGKLPIPKLPFYDASSADVKMDDFVNRDSVLNMAKMRGNNLDLQLTWTPITFTEATDMNELLETNQLLPDIQATQVQSLIERLEQDIVLAQLLESKPDEDLKEALEVDEMVMQERAPASPVLQASDRAFVIDDASFVDTDMPEVLAWEHDQETAEHVPMPTSPAQNSEEPPRPLSSAGSAEGEEDEDWASVITASRAIPHTANPGIKISNADRLNAFMTARGRAALQTTQPPDAAVSNPSSQVVSAESDAREEIKSPATTIPDEEQSPYPAVRCLASLRLLQNTSLMSRLSAAGFDLVEVDEEPDDSCITTQPDLVLDSTTTVLFYKLLKVPGQETLLAESLQSFSTCYNTILLIFEMYLGKEEKPIQLTPPLQKSLDILKGHLSNLSCGLLVKFAMSSTQAIEQSRELAEERRSQIIDGAFSSWGNRNWLSDQLSEDAAYLMQIQGMSSFGAQFLSSCVGVDPLLAWTDEERMQHLSGEFGAQVQVINQPFDTLTINTGRTKGAAGKTQTVKQNVEAGAAKPSYTAGDVLIKANELIGQCNFDLAHQFCVRALELEPENASALETIAAVELELGEPESAREHLLKAVDLTKDTRPSASAHLYLAQLSDPQESLQWSTSALDILKTRLEGLSKAAANGMSNGKEREWSEEEVEIRRSASRALVGMTELYLTDLCFEADAETKCEELLQSAIQFDPTDPEVYQTMASVRLSQERDEDAVQALDKSWSIWRAAEPGSSNIPPFASRTSLAKLFIETNQYLSALEILITLEYEDDTDIQVQYLLGLTWYCLAEQRYHGTSPPGGDGPGLNETAEESGIEARDYFENCLKLQAKQEDEDEADQAMIQHVLEMRSTLCKAGVPETPAEEEGSQNGEAGDGWEDASDDESKDVEMAT